MKVFNLTDVRTENLERRGLYNQSFVVGSAVIAPGESGEVSDDHRVIVQAALEHLVAAQALAVDKIPAEYSVIKMKQTPKATAPIVPTNMKLPTPPKDV